MAECIRTSRSSSLVTPLLMAPLTCHRISWARPRATSMAIVSMLRVPREMPSRPQTEPKQYRVTSSSNSRVKSGWLSTLARPCSRPSTSSRIAIPFSYSSSSMGSSLVSSTSNDIRFSQPPPSTGGPPMTENLHLVFSKPPEAISDEEYNRWYDFHLGEVLVVPGFVSARRYRLETVKGDWTPSGHRYLSAYEIEGDPRDVMNELDKEVASGRMQLPGWFPQITFASFNCHSHGNPAGARLADHLYLVFSAPPEGLGNDEFVAWYREHADENTQVPGFLANWRFRLEPEVIDPSSQTVATHLALYEVDRDLAELRANLAAARVTNEAGWPSWFDPTPWTSLDANAIGDRVPAPARTLIT